MQTAASRSCWAVTSEIWPPGLVYFAALISRLVNICANRTGSASTSTGWGGTLQSQLVMTPADERTSRIDRDSDSFREIHRASLQLDIAVGDARNV
jgi:hypothetical protein